MLLVVVSCLVYFILFCCNLFFDKPEAQAQSAQATLGPVQSILQAHCRAKLEAQISSFFTCELKPKAVHPSAFLLSPLQDRHVHRWPSPRKPRRHNMQGHHPAAFISSSKPRSRQAPCSLHAVFTLQVRQLPYACFGPMCLLFS